jgi:ribonuclease HI
MDRAVVIHTDGASRGNPGKASIAYVIEGLAKDPIEFYKAIGETTNNQAEYQAVIAAMSFLASENIAGKELHFFADSELVVKQIKGEYRVRDASIKPVFDQVKQLQASLEKLGNDLRFTAVRRAENKRADYLANVALDSPV